MRTMLAPLLGLLVLTSCNARPPGGVDVEQTVAHVQNILQKNPELPRLDRDQILSLLQDIRAEDALSNSTNRETSGGETVPTVDDAENEIPKESDIYNVQALSTEEPRLVLITEKPNKFKQFSVKNSAFSGRETNWDEPRVMVVLPFTPSEGTDLDELFTRPPLTAVVSASSLPSSGHLKHVNVIPLSTTPTTSTTESSATLSNNLSPENTGTSVKKSKNDHKDNSRRETSSENDLKHSGILINVNNDDIKPKTPTRVEIQNSRHESPIPIQYTDLSAELKEFLDTYGFDRNPTIISPHSLYSDFKPLPAGQPVTGSKEEVPEDLLLTYDLLPNSESLAKPDSYDEFYGNYGAIKAGFADLDSLSSVPKPSFAKTDGRGSKKIHNGNDAYMVAAASADPFKVVPLSKGPSPILALSEFNINESNDLFKRQNSNSEKESTADSTTTKSDASTERSEIEDNLSLDSSTETTTRKSDASTEKSEIEDNMSPDSSTEKEIALDSESSAGSTDIKLDSLAATDDKPDSTASAAESPSVSDLESSFGAPPVLDPSESELPPPRRNGFYFMLDWNSFLEVGDGDNKVNIRFEPKLGDPQMFLPVSVP